MNNEIPAAVQLEKKGKGIWKVIRVHLLILAAYAIVIPLHSPGFMILVVLALISQILFLLIRMIINFSRKKKEEATAYLISFIVISVVGFFWLWIISFFWWILT